MDSSLQEKTDCTSNLFLWSDKNVCTVTEIEMWLKEPVTLVTVALVMVTLVMVYLG